MTKEMALLESFTVFHGFVDVALLPAHSELSVGTVLVGEEQEESGEEEVSEKMSCSCGAVVCVQCVCMQMHTCSLLRRVYAYVHVYIIDMYLYFAGSGLSKEGLLQLTYTSIL